MCPLGDNASKGTICPCATDMIPKKVIRIIFFNIVRCRLYTIGPSVLVALIPVGAVVGVRLFYYGNIHKKEARESVSLLIPLFWAFALPLVLNKQCPKPTPQTHGAKPYVIPWTRNTALLRYQSEVAKFRIAADKRCYNVFSILCLCRPPTCPRGLREGTTVQNYEKVSIWEKKYAGAGKRARSQYRRHCDLAEGIGCGLVNLVEAQVGHQALGHEDAVGGLVVLEDGGHDARQGEGRAVEGVAELGPAGLVVET